MKKIFIALASLGLLMLTSCGAKTTPPAVVPIDNGTPTQNTTNNTYNTSPGTTTSPTSTTNTSNTSGATYTTQPVTSNTTNTGKKVVRRSCTTKRSSVTQTSTSYAYEPYAGYFSDYRGVYPQPYTQPSYPSTTGYSIYDFMGAYNAQH